jgi:hypothetical protein
MRLVELMNCQSCADLEQRAAVAEKYVTILIEEKRALQKQIDALMESDRRLRGLVDALLVDKAN